MNKKTSLILIVAVLFCLIVTAYAQTQKAGPAGQGWEYREVNLPRTESGKPKLNALGTEGWELVSVVAACEDQQYCQYYAYLKRRK